MYTEFEIIESKDIREEILNNNNSLAIMENYKTINTVNKTEYASVKQVAEYFNVTLDCIQQLILRNKEELIENGLLILKGNETKNILGNDNLSLPKI